MDSDFEPSRFRRLGRVGSGASACRADVSGNRVVFEKFQHVVNYC